MAPVPLNISPALRPWRQAGITHLLLADEVRERLLARPSAVADALESATPAGTSGSSAPSRPPAREEPASRAAHPVPPPPDAAPVPEHRPAPPREGRSVQADAPPPERWPAYWRDLLKKTPPRPSVVWTYPTLSRDLGGDADAAHRDFLRRLLGDMGLPKGSHAFWPLNRYPYGEGESPENVDARLFLSGVATLNPDSVILMCGRVPAQLGLADLSPLLPRIVHGRRFVVTPHVDALIGEPQRYAQLITFLKALFAGR